MSTKNPVSDRHAQVLEEPDAFRRAVSNLPPRIGNFKLELGNLNRHEDLARFHEAIAMAIFYYNHQRIHLSLKMSPAAYAARLKVQNQQSKSLERVLQKTGA